MNEWLKIMLEEIRRKQREAREEAEEHRRREGKRVYYRIVNYAALGLLDCIRAHKV